MFEGLLQPTHLILILAITLLVFGPSRLGEVGTGLGRAIREFKKQMADDVPSSGSSAEGGRPASASTAEPAAPRSGVGKA